MTREELVAVLSRSLDEPPKRVSGGILLGHIPHVAPLAYLHRIYPVASASDLDALQATMPMAIPQAYRSFLSEVGNGASFFSSLSLFGCVAQLRRSVVDGLGQPISLRYGNVVDRPRGLDPSTFSIGSIVGWSSRGMLTMDPGGEIRLVHQSDGRDVAVRWPDLDSMLFSEIERCSALHDRTGRQLVPATELMHPNGRKWETKVEPPERAESTGWATSLLRTIRQRFTL